MKNLKQKLSRLEGQSYGAYKSIKGRYKFDGFDLQVDYIQGDPFAEPSRLRVFVPMITSQIPEEFFDSNIKSIALRDYLTRNFYIKAAPHSHSCGSGKSGLIGVDEPLQQILERTSVFVSSKEVELRFVAGLPANGRRILGQKAIKMLCDYIPQAVTAALMFKNIDEEKLRKHLCSVEDAESLRDQLPVNGLIGFIADGSNLPRSSGIDDRPLQGEVVNFKAPDSLAVSLETPHSGQVRGMGIKKGITVIVGGGYHGKSTVLKALELGVYNHIPGDGRERVVCDRNAMKIRSEDGRSVCGVTITPFISNLPLGRTTDDFSTENASGSTSQAAAIIEAIEAGCKTLLIDEDTSATNFMIRDRRMQALITKENEPITPFTDKVGHLKKELGISSVLVMGGSGDYFILADTVIAMNSYVPSEVTSNAHKIANEFDTGRLHEGGRSFGQLKKRLPSGATIKTARGKRDPHFRVRRTEEIELGEERIDCSSIAGLVHESQLRAIAWTLIEQKAKFIDVDIKTLLQGIEEELDMNGLRNLNPKELGNLAHFRAVDFAAVLNRIRTLRVK
jgi:predicted ABC-class ATPase